MEPYEHLINKCKWQTVKCGGYIYGRGSKTSVTILSVSIKAEKNEIQMLKKTLCFFLSKRLNGNLRASS